MAKSPWKQRQREAIPSSPPETPLKMPIKSMLKYAFQIFAQKYVQLLAPFLIFAVIMAVIKLFIIPDINWNFHLINDFWERVMYKRLLDPTYTLTAQESQVYLDAYQYYWFAQILLGFLDAVPQYLGILTTVLIVERSYKTIIGEGKKNPFGFLLAESFTSPFRGGKAGSAIFVAILLSFLVPLGLTFFLVPGFLVLIYLQFSLQVVSFQKFSTINILRAGFDHARKQFVKVLGVIFLGFLCTFGWEQLRSVTLNLLWPAPETSFYNPATRDFVGIFLYLLVQNIWIALVLPLVASLYTMLYLQIQTEKAITPSKPSLPDVSDEEVDNIAARRTQQMRYCPNCGRATPVHLKACIHCKRLIRSF
jgi:hypothetical protein